MTGHSEHEPSDDPGILEYVCQGVNVFGLFLLFLGLFPASILVATVELPQWLAGTLLLSGVVFSILLDLLVRFGVEPQDDWKRFFRLSTGGCVLWMPYWLSWFVMVPVTVAISLLRRH